ncbi:MAG TPA: hypothetical protein VLL75_07930, partial [Vicinamibacteria bacterium]|nr:hypothetical protein [Vicinamibacteria bacterium]
MAERQTGGGTFVVAALLAGALGPTAPGMAQELGERAQQQLRAIFAEKASRTPAQRKLDTSLLYASRESRGLAMVQGLAPRHRVVDRARVDANGMAVVHIRGQVTDRLVQTIAGLGGKVAASLPAYGAVRAVVPIRQVEAIAELPEVRSIRPPEGFLVNAGSQLSQGDAAHTASLARGNYSLDGTGVKIGVLSDGVDSRAARQTSGDLPPTCTVTPGPGACLTVLTGQEGSDDEGTAMMEVIHDLAPGAKLYFAGLDVEPLEEELASNILALRNTYGCDIIVDDVTFFGEGAFQDGVIAQAVNAVTNAGVLYFSSAGNSGRKSASTSGTWEGDFLNSGTIPAIFVGDPFYGDKQFHSWNGLTGASSVSNPLTALAPYQIWLKWSDPLGGAVTDYDLFLLDSTLSDIVDWSSWFQYCTPDDDPASCSDEPSEWLGYGEAGETIVVAAYWGPPKALRLDTFQGRLTYSTPRATFGHNAGEGTVSVAATDARVPGAGNPFVGGTTNPVEPYSSDGPRRLFYNPNGTPITPGNVLFATGGGRDVRKPDITAADCVVTASPPTTPPNPANPLNPFCG